MSNTIRTRIAPSPTGRLHVGLARAALFNELFARKHKGSFIVRMEDTDPERSRKEHEEDILRGFSWLGLSWDEGPDKDGIYGPYRQSERTKHYIVALQDLLHSNKAYICACTHATEYGKRHTCDCASKNLTEGALRLHVDEGEVVFHDEIRGDVHVHTNNFGGDFVIARSLENPLYHIAVVVDDHAMNITHVIRGEDHIHNTAKHILLQEALGYARPVYAHLPLILDESRKKLSKRRNETSLLAYKEMGYMPEAMLNYLALLGWNPKDDREYFTHTELIQAFSLEGVQKGGAIFSTHKLDSINQHYIRSLSIDDLYRRVKEFFAHANVSYDISDEAYWKAAIQTEQERVKTLADFVDSLSFFQKDLLPSYEESLLVWRKSTPEQTRKLLDALIEKLNSLNDEEYEEKTLESVLLSWIDEENLGRGDVLWPMRVALTGAQHSPGPFEVAGILKKEEVLKRLHYARKIV